MAELQVGKSEGANQTAKVVLMLRVVLIELKVGRRSRTVRVDTRNRNELINLPDRLCCIHGNDKCSTMAVNQKRRKNEEPRRNKARILIADWKALITTWLHNVAPTSQGFESLFDWRGCRELG